MRFLSILTTLALGGMAAAASAQDYLAANADISTGRDALRDARAKVGENTYTTYTKPANDIVLIQEFDADTNERLYAVALVNDEQAEEYYSKHKEGDVDESGPIHKRCSECGGGGPRCDRAVDVDAVPALFRRASRCNQFCGRSPDCTGDVRCPRCVYVGGRCQWQLRCRPRDEL